MTVILLMRHAEKPDGVALGVDEMGAADEQSLIVRGWQRAGALPGLFGKEAPLPAPDRIYATATLKLKTPDGKIGSRSKRPTETVSVLAARLGLKTNGTFTKGQEAALVAETRHARRHDPGLLAARDDPDHRGEHHGQCRRSAGRLARRPVRCRLALHPRLRGRAVVIRSGL